MNKIKNNLEGQRFGRLVAIKWLGKIKNQMKWLCKCDCGKECTPSGWSLINGKTISCGCYQREVCTRHGHTIGGHTPEYQIWANIKDRCFNLNNANYDKYGGRGIGMFEGWVNSFDAFIKYLGERPSIKHSVDRYPNNDGNYEPGNIRWATPAEQMRNTSNTHNLTYMGKTLCIVDWAKETGLSRTTINERLRRGWSVDAVLSSPTQEKYNSRKNITI